MNIETMTKTKALNIIVKKFTTSEGGKKQLNAGDAREIIKIITVLMATDADFMDAWNLYEKAVFVEQN